MLHVRALPKFEAPIILYISLPLSLAQADTVGPNYPSLEDTIYQPNLAVVIGILGVIFVVTILIILYARLCRRDPHRQSLAGPLGTSGRFSGLNKTVIESLPFFRFSSLKGSKDGLECSVCLSRFEGVEVLRLLPKCKHAFHVDCIDRWLERHSTCPLCRDRVCPEDVKLIAYSNSMRILLPEPREEPSDVEIFVQREESRRWSSRFWDPRAFHRHNHKMVVSGSVFKNRWSNVSSSDLLFLSSEMLNTELSGRFASQEMNEEIPASSKAKLPDPIGDFESTSRSVVNSGQKRSVSEITGMSRYGDLSGEVSSRFEDDARGERVRKVWLQIAKRRVQWFVDHRERSRSAQNSQRQSIVV